ncbi:MULTISPECIES: response regulator transcription factor [unclassified Neptuniibacter]|uniref:response regulator n=1 Tax=unclassified Neptuniibacter TaxID=2630693 RepID=UPI000C45A1B2|nr:MULTISPECIES: response regulator transcription factor [unclassified Neptuniibacter]MAY43344.1 DNA-binding response regulator [Oceanospirillaceae bacterium]|tara:strand:- start:7162 stop:7818 length:657 start_codon:yes stop_codon:yes gene_type:complete
MNPINILLVDDHAIVREGYRSLLNRQPGFNIIAEAETGEEAYTLFRQHNPDLVLLDLSLPGKGGLATLCQIRKFSPKAKVIIFSMHQNPAMAKKAIEAGAVGYITKSSNPSTLLNAVKDTMKGGISISDDITKALALESLQGSKILINSLSTREFEILQMLVNGTSKQEVADTLCISQKTVSNHYYLIKSKLNAKNDIELIRTATEAGLVSPINLVAS